MIKQDDEGYLDITEEHLKSGFIDRINDAQTAIKTVKERLEVMKRAKKELFDNVVDIADALVKDGEMSIQGIVADLQDMLDFIVKDFSLLAFEKDVKWKDEEKYKLNPDIEIDESWVEQTIDDVIDETNREGGYNYRRNNVL